MTKVPFPGFHHYLRRSGGPTFTSYIDFLSFFESMNGVIYASEILVNCWWRVYVLWEMLQDQDYSLIAKQQWCSDWQEGALERQYVQINYVQVPRSVDRGVYECNMRANPTLTLCNDLAFRQKKKPENEKGYMARWAVSGKDDTARKKEWWKNRTI